MSQGIGFGVQIIAIIHLQEVPIDGQSLADVDALRKDRDLSVDAEWEPA
jgi:hypothetical protein